MSYFKKNELYSVTLSRPIITLETFKADFEFWQYLTNEVKLTSFSYYPSLGLFAFFKNDEDRDKFNERGEWNKSEVSNYKHGDVYEKVVELVAAAKQKIFENQLSTEEDIRDAIDSSANALGLDISSEDAEKLTDMLMKVSEVDVDVDAIKEQATELYNKLKDKGIEFSNVDTSGLIEKVGDFFANIFNAIKDFFVGLFG